MIVATAVLWMVATVLVCADDAPEPAKLSSRTTRQIEGWTVRIDDCLLQPPNEELGQHILKFLEAKLTDITLDVGPGPLAKLRTVAIVVDLSHGKLRTMRYHPSAGWLKENGYDTNLAKCMHIPYAAGSLPPPTPVCESQTSRSYCDTCFMVNEDAALLNRRLHIDFRITETS